MKTESRVICILLAVSLCQAADFRQFDALYRAILDSKDDAAIPRVEELTSQDMEDSIKALKPTEVEDLLPLAKRCWQSTRAGIKTEGLSLLVGISLREDSTALIEPYIDGLSGLLTSSEDGVRKTIVYVFGATNPQSSPRALVHLATHLEDKNNSQDEFRMTAAAILRPGLSDRTTIRHVLLAVQRHPEFRIGGAIVEMLGAYRIATQEAIEFIRRGLNEGDQGIQQTSVDAVARTPAEVRSDFAQDLQRIANDPSVPGRLRSRAASVLTTH